MQIVKTGLSSVLLRVFDRWDRYEGRMRLKICAHILQTLQHLCNISTYVFITFLFKKIVRVIYVTLQLLERFRHCDIFKQIIRPCYNILQSYRFSGMFVYCFKSHFVMYVLGCANVNMLLITLHLIHKMLKEPSFYEVTSMKPNIIKKIVTTYLKYTSRVIPPF